MRKRRRLFRRIRAVVLVILLSSAIFNVSKGMPTEGDNLDIESGNNLNIELDNEPITPDKFVVIDPGHGGIDGGTIGFSGSYEKDINLKISKKLEKELKAMGYKVILTRNKDEFMNHTSRAEIANKDMPDLFLSIHGNSIENHSDVNGVQVFYFPNKEGGIEDASNKQLAEIMLNSILKETGAKDMGTMGGNLMVLRNTKMPAILIEYGFLSNENEERLLLTDEYQNKIVDGMVKGLEEYFTLTIHD